MDTIALWEQEIENKKEKEDLLKQEAVYNFFGDIVENVTVYDFFSENVILEDVAMINEAKEPTDKEKKEFEKVLKDNKVNKNDFKKAANNIKSAFGIDILAVSGTIVKHTVSIIQKEGLTKTSKAKITSYWNKEFDKLADDINKSVENGVYKKDFFASNKKYQEFLDNRKAFSRRKMSSAIVLLVRVVAVNTILSGILTALFGVPGFSLFAIIIGPIIEENSKIVAVKGDFIAEYTLIFNIFEFTSYVSSNPSKVFMKMRLIVVGMHLTTSIIHYLSIHTELTDKINLDKLGLKDSDKNKPNHIVLGSFLGLLIHMCWNAGLSVKVIKAILKVPVI